MDGSLSKYKVIAPFSKVTETYVIKSLDNDMNMGQK